MMNKYFDHTYLKPEGSYSDIDKLIEEAKEYEFFSVCIQPYYVKYAKQKLASTDVKVATVVGFPQGTQVSEVKAFETKRAVEDGADEIDMVMAYGLLKAKRYDEVLNDIKLVRQACRGKVLKVILETSQLTDEEIIKACELCDKAQADFVKTSTGFYGEGAKEEHVKLMKENFSKEVKASGGIRTLEDAQKMIKAGATRLGASAGGSIIKEIK